MRFIGRISMPHAHVSHLDAYDAQHRHPLNRALHSIGIPIVLFSVVAMALPRRPFGWSRRSAVALFVGGWGLLFAGHAIEGNRPAILDNPVAALSGALWWVRGFGARGVAACRRATTLIAAQDRAQP